MGLDAAYFVLFGKEYFFAQHRKGAFNPQPLFDELKAYELDRVRAVARYAS